MEGEDEIPPEMEYGGSESPISPTEETATEVSLNSVIGLTSPKTMKLMGKIGERKVVVMIDPGATHNFVSLEAVRELGIPVFGSSEFGVSLGNGEAVRGAGVCEQINLELEGGSHSGRGFSPLGAGKLRYYFRGTMAREIRDGCDKLENSGDAI